MLSPQTPLPPDEDRGPQLQAMHWTWTALASVFLALRFHVRIRMRMVGWDDWMMLFSTILFIIGTSVLTYATSLGGSRHIFYLTPTQALAAAKWSVVSQPWIIFLYATAKTSIGLLTLRFIGPTSLWRRYTIHVVIVIMLVMHSLGCIFTFAQCNPPHALWTPNLPGSSCWHPTVLTRFNYVLSALDIAADVILALMPSTFIVTLKLNIGKKISLCALLALGLLGATCCAIRIRYLVDLTSRDDITWYSYNVQVWAGAEAFVIILCGNLPPMAPLWGRFVTRTLDASYGRVPLNYQRSGFSRIEASQGIELASKKSLTTHEVEDRF